MCQCVLLAHILTYQSAMRANVLKWQRTLRAYVFTCQRVLHDYVLACLACSRAHVLTCFNVVTYQRTFACLPVDKQRYQKYQMYIFISNIIYNIKYQIAKISSNIKNKFPITCFLLFLIFFLFLFPVKLNCIWKVHDKRECLYNFFFFFFWEFSCTFWHTSYQAKTFNECYDKLCTTKWFDFCLSRTLGWLAHLVSRLACNTRVIDDASSNPPVSNVKSL